MAGKNQIFQFKIALAEMEPEIWRRIQAPSNYSFWDFHVAVQDAMGWADYHLHQFSVLKPGSDEIVEIGIPDDQFGVDDDNDLLTGWEVCIGDYFNSPGDQALYEYDFGDDWRHHILLEDILKKEKGVKYPKCIAGERKCPPEDCGGCDGYFDFLEAVMNSNHEDHEEMMEWCGGEYDPYDFNPETVKFDDPAKRWKQAFERR